MKMLTFLLSIFVWTVAFGCAPTVAEEWRVIEAEDSYIVLFENTLDAPVCIQEPSYLYNLLAEREGSNALDEHRDPAPHLVSEPGVVRLSPGNLIGTRIGKSSIATLQDVASPSMLRFVYRPAWAPDASEECEKFLGVSFSGYVRFEPPLKE